MTRLGACECWIYMDLLALPSHRLFCACLIFSIPAVVLGPVDSPPCIRHLFLPLTTFALHGLPDRVLAPQVGRWILGRSV